MTRTGWVLLVLACAWQGCAARPPRSAAPPAGTGCADSTPLPCERACFAGNAEACAIFGCAVGGVADAPVRLPQDLPRGERALKKGCQLGSLNACRELVSYQTDRAVPGSDCAGWEDLCKQGDQRSCTFFGQCLDHVDSFRRDRPQALRLFEEGCERGERVACRELAFLSLSGEMVPRDLARGFVLLDRACRMNDPLACAHEGRLLERGQGTPPDLTRAKELYRRSCARGIRPIPCESLRRLGEVPPRSAVTSPDATESVYTSAALDFELRVAANWQLVPPDTVPLSDAPTAVERVAVRPRAGGAPSDSLLLAVTDYVSIVPGRDQDRDPETLDALEREATEWLSVHGLTREAVRRTKFLGFNAVRVEARVGDPANSLAVTLILFRKDRRRFELRCLTSERPSDVPCADAIGALEIHEPKGVVREEGRVLHLREAGLGLSFDAPDDGWLAFGPRLGFGGHQQVWIWVFRGQQIDVGALDLQREMPARMAEVIASGMADRYRAEGATVTIDQSILDGQPCSDVLVDGKQGAQDLLIQVRGRFAYSILVTSSTHDEDLLTRVRAGIHFASAPTR